MLINNIRLIEQIMLCDNINKKEQNVLPYFATADKGLINAMNINPLKAFVILGKYPISVHSLSVEDVCKNKEILLEIENNSLLRKHKINGIDLSVKKKNLQSEIHEIALQRMVEN